MADQENRRLGRILKMSVRDVRALDGSFPAVPPADETAAAAEAEKPAQDAGGEPSTYDLSG